MHCLSGSGPKIQSNRLEHTGPHNSQTGTIIYNRKIFVVYSSGNAEKQFNAKMASALKKQQKSISDLSEIVKHLAYDIREVRDGAARNIDTLFKEKKTHEKRSMARLYPKVAEEIRDLAIKHKKGVAISDATVRNFHKKLTKNPKEDTLDSLKLWVSKQKGDIDSEPESEEEEETNHDS
ncbi:hypothetical protein Glove_73g10 [Diversispora epigaea]|uniref:Uncharacterized protein n=1 Tax=Diversispora epigaea TaxID=1348612 RepID=A0A397JBW1_9GLOM|nr:hypothetical protein Glove_73g10 [Diversispora epigaea]